MDQHVCILKQRFPISSSKMHGSSAPCQESDSRNDAKRNEYVAKGCGKKLMALESADANAAINFQADGSGSELGGGEWEWAGMLTTQGGTSICDDDEDEESADVLQVF